MDLCAKYRIQNTVSRRVTTKKVLFISTDFWKRQFRDFVFARYFFGLPGNSVWKGAVGVGPVDTLGWEEWV
jgi:hypothetical protein